MLSPLEQKQTIGERIRRRSTRSPLRVTISPVASRLPTNNSSTIHWISSPLRLTCPPHHFLELDEALALGIHLRPQVVVLGPQRVGGIQVLEILDQVPAVELAVAQVAGQRRHPAAAGQTAGVAHRVLAFHAGPVRQRRTGDDDRAEQLGPDRGHQQHGPAALAVADDAGLAFCLGMQRDDAFQEHRLGVHDVFDGLARHRVGRETDEVAGMAGMHGHADFAVGLEAADARPVPGARIDHHERPLQRIEHARLAPA